MDAKTNTTKEPGESRAAPRAFKNQFGPEVENFMKMVGVPNLSALAAHFGIHPVTLRGRLARGYSIRPAVGLEPLDEKVRKNQFGPEVENFMKMVGVPNLPALAAHYGLKPANLHSRLRSGQPIRVALGIDRRPGEIVTASKVYPSLMHACRGVGVSDEAIYTYRREHGCTTQEAFDAVLSARRSKRIIKTKKALAKIPMPDPVVFGWRFTSWSAAAEYWGGMKHAKRPQAVIAFVRTQPLVPESIFAAVRHEFDIRGMLDPETGLIKGRSLPKGTVKA